MSIPKLPGIYLLRNKINSKCYVGETIDLSRRYNQYKWSNNNRREVIVKAIVKYGFDNFEFIILKTFDKINKTILWIYENHFIKEYNSLNPNGYNFKPWGRGNWGKLHTGESKKKISQSNSGNKNGMYGKTHSDKYKLKRAQLASKKLKQIDVITGEVVAIWESAKKATETLLGHQSFAIYDAINGRRKTIYGYKWEHADCDEKLFISNLDKIQRKKKPPISQSHRDKISYYQKNRNFNYQKIAVCQIDKDTKEIIKIWDSARDAAKTLGYSNCNICTCCRGRRPTAYNYIWEYVK